MSNMQTAVDWFNARRGRVTYSMAYRGGPYSYDCSSAVYFALQAAGIFPRGLMGNTESMFHHLPAYGFEQLSVSPDGTYHAQMYDIFIWGVPGQSSGGAGHTGIFVDSVNIIHCNYGYNGITINNHDAIHAANGYPDVTIFRYTGGGVQGATVAAAHSTETGVKFAPEFSGDAPHWTVEAGDTLVKIARYYGIPEKLGEIARYNKLANPNLLRVGQKIFIPKPLVWVVEAGDKASAVNAYYGYPAGMIEKLNPGKRWAPGEVFTVWG